MRTFPDQVRVEYYDAALPEVRAHFCEVVEEARQRYWPYPLVLVNDQLVLAGDVNVYRLSKFIREELPV
jgi:disulfide oxidoreductase YuzD